MNAFFSRRKFLNLTKSSLVFLLASCSNVSKKIIIGLQKTFIPKIFLDYFPRNSIFENINFAEINNQVNIETKFENLDFLIVNDGWISNLQIDQFREFNKSLLSMLDEKAINYLNLFENSYKHRLFPIGVIPYALVIKNNRDFKITSKQSWDFLLNPDLKGKLILPNSSRLIISIAKKLNTKNSLTKLIKQVKVYDDINSLDWLVNSDARVAIIPSYLSKKYLKVDPRLSIIYPDSGVPLIWNFLLINSKNNEEFISKFINSLSSVKVRNKLISEGWFIPFRESHGFNDLKNTSKKSLRIKNISKECWKNSWSFTPLSLKEKKDLETFWSRSLTP